MKIALRIEAGSFRGTRLGAPRLAEILKSRDAGATFLFAVGPDQTGRAIGRAFRQGFRGKIRHASAFRHFGVKTLLYGTLLPAPDIGRECAAVMRDIRDAGFEAGLHAWNPVLWMDRAKRADAAWTRQQMDLARERFEEIFKEPARIHGAPGWQMNRHAYRLTQRLGFGFCSDTRGVSPFVPVCDGEIVACPQLPTTLPTLDELIGANGVTAENVVEHLLQLTQEPVPAGHVFTLHAELGTTKFAAVFEALLDGWIAQGHEAVSLGGYMEAMEFSNLPRHEAESGMLPGRAGELSRQGREFLADAKIPPPIVERRASVA
ncbi:MAG TPA: 4-deoxy-4-formamido-L-arabinose-phosphoundecaprenol deformylase [Burkholderiales bacterium]|nr:4-deoxy-4-formamido-L-arabinose-phosphoundecaprenol deformylase [Burkholderiales bacterium]